MADVLVWLVAVEIIGLAVFPICFFLLPRLKDRGFFISKPLGILAIGYLSWILSVAHILPSVQAGIAGLVVVVGGLAWWYGWRKRDEIVEFVLRERASLLVGEAIFLVVFFGWVFYRSYDPAIDHTEQPMDFAFLNASVRSSVGEPTDPWLSGLSISYYYFGYWMMGTLTKLTGIASAVSYNLSLALVPALGAMGVFGLAYNVILSDSRKIRYALAAGIVAAILLGASANSQGTLEFMRANGIGSEGFWEWVDIEGMTEPPASLSDSWRPEEFLWWWRATRVIRGTEDGELTDYTIHEFPFFSFILGDLHPHVMSIPFVVLFLTLCWNLFRSPVHVWGNRDLRQYATVVLVALALGTLGFTNMWDLPVFAAVLVGVIWLRSYMDRGESLWAVAKATVPLGALIIGLALVFIAPYLVGFTSQVGGVSAISGPTSRPFHLLIVWVVSLVAVVPLVMGVFWQTTVRSDWARLTIVSLGVGFLPFVVWTFMFLEGGGESGEVVGRFVHVLPWALLVAIAVYGTLWLARSSEPELGKIFSLSLVTLGLLLIMGPELLHVDDSFGGPWERMNTVFKFYYQAWIVLSIGAGFAFYYWGSQIESSTGWTRVMLRSWSVVFVLLVGASAYYPMAAATTKANSFSGDATLDGLAYVERFNAAEYRAIAHIDRNADGDSVIVEAVGDDYSAFGRISASTGVPTILGWQGHELQWRGSSDAFVGRNEDVTLIYTTTDAFRARNLLARYDVEYVYVGPRERAQYGEEGLQKFAEFMDEDFREGDVVVYKTRR